MVLAGGRGRRMGAEKATVSLCGRPLISYPLAALAAVLGEVAVVAKADSELPELPEGVAVWRDSGDLQHPLVGVIEALRRAGGRAVLVCAVDLPLVTPAVVTELVAAASGSGATAVIARGQPLLGCYQPHALGKLEALGPAGPVREAAAALSPHLVEVGDPGVLLNVNTSDDLRRAEALLAERP